MMTEIRNQTIRGRGSQGEYNGHSFEDCIFENCRVPCQTTPGTWTIIRDIGLHNVVNANCSIDTAILQDIHLRNLKRQGRFPLFLWGCVFRHVTLSGKISALKINRYVGPAADVSATQRAWDAKVLEFYERTDWALDISKAKFAGSVSFEAIPGDKIRRDPKSQVLITRERLRATEWRDLDYGNSAFDIAISWFLEHSIFDSVVLAARMGAKEAMNDLEVLGTLRERGVAE